MSNRIPLLNPNLKRTGEPRERPYRDSGRGKTKAERARHEVTGYDTLHPTKGWKRVSFRRLRYHQTIVPA